MIDVVLTEDRLEIISHAPASAYPGRTLFVALGIDPAVGSAVVPFAQGREGSTVFLPFRADRIFLSRATANGVTSLSRTWNKTLWSEPHEAGSTIEATSSPDDQRLRIPISELGARQFKVVAYLKDLSQNDGWGAMLPDSRFGTTAGINDKMVPRFISVDVTQADSFALRNRLGTERVRIYQLLPRLFGNTNETRKPNGTLAENGCGKFADINDSALAALREMSITHIWLTGVLQQATATAYPEIGVPADDPDLLKGLAGSPYAVKDCFDVCPDYAINPADRVAEFRELLARIHQHGMQAIIDFVPNHVARSYQSDIQPDLSFGAYDDRSSFFDPRNNFFYLRSDDHGHGPPLLLPTVQDGNPVSATCKMLGTCTGRFTGELDHGRVTGNNIISWTPKLEDWYETVKLNYGFDFTTGTREYPHGENCDKLIPDTWQKMDRVLAYWQELGVNGFRCDMAHMVPPEFWSWAIGRARIRQPGVWFMAEAYDNDPAKVRGGDPLLQALNGNRGNVMFDLLSAGFDAVYDDPSYKTLKAIYDGSGWANDLDNSQPHDYIFHNSLRYAENHDEVRLAGGNHWGGAGMNVGRTVASILYALGRGPAMLYHGQEVGEPADGEEGFSGDDARTTIYDYWSMPEFTKWVNGHRYDGAKLSPEQRELRAFYSRLLKFIGEPAFREGEFFALNPSNLQNEHFGRMPGETASGHWLYAFLRASEDQRVLVVVNLHVSASLRDVQIHLPESAMQFLGLESDHEIALRERLSTESVPSSAVFSSSRVHIQEIPPLTSYFFEILPRPAK
ncbi:alpha-amylase family glycosyl hydrolase [Verrucomicrobiota bacterium sgz303538]